MRAITARGNRTTEAKLRALLVRSGIKGWKLHPQTLPGAPDFLFERERVVIFTHGCFWHGCARCGRIPRTNSSYWRAKITRNRQRDRKSRRALRRAGYVVIALWECQLRDSARQCVLRIASTVARLSD